MRRGSLVPILLATLAVAGSAWAQNVVAAKAGMIHYSEGQVSVNDEAVTIRDSAAENQEFKFVKEGETLATGRGRTEILLNPGTFLRVAENSSIRMISSDLEDTRLELIAGSALVEISELEKYHSVVVEVGGLQVQLRKQGLYQFTAGESGKLRVYDGEAAIAGIQDLKIKKGREISLNLSAAQLATLEPAKFDRDENDALYRWSARRERVLARVNQSSALLAANNGFNGTSAWAYNSMFGMYTFLPGNGYGYSPFGGIRYYSPRTVVYLYQPVIVPSSGFDNGGGLSSPARSASPVYTNNGGSSAASVGTRSAAPAAAAPAASPNTGSARRR